MHPRWPQGVEISCLVRDHAARVRRALARRGVAAADLPDVEQEVFLIAHKKLAEFEGRSSFATWLLGIASNVASQHRRLARHRREQLGLSTEPASEALDPLARLQAIDAVTQVRRLLDGLPEEQREVIVLHELSELSMHETARELGVPLKTAFSRLYAGHRALRRALERDVRRADRRKASRVGAFAGFILGLRFLPRAHALQLAAFALACATLATPPDSRALVLRSSAEPAALEAHLRGPALTVLASATPTSPTRAPKRAALAPTPTLSLEPAPDLVVIRFDEDAHRRPPYAHPFEERALTSVDPTRIKPRLLHREAFCRAHAPCAL